MKEIKIFLDKGKKNEVKDTIQFNNIVAGEKSSKKLYIFSTVNLYIDIDISVEGKFVKIVKNIKSIDPVGKGEIELEIFPNITTMKPIEAKLNIKINYIIT